MSISDWSSDVCPSDLIGARVKVVPHGQLAKGGDGGCDLVATIGFDDHAMGHMTFLAQCAASSNEGYRRNKVAEPGRFEHLYKSEALRVGKEWCRTCESRWWSEH